MARRILLFTTLGFFAVLVLWSVPTVPTTMAAQDAGYVQKGRELFRENCAVCHGVDAQGSGPAASQLKKQPADLTVLQKRGEEFPIYKIMNYIDGEKVVPAHGTRDMPIWGKVFRRTKDEMRGQGDIYALAEYLKSIQKYSK